MKNVIGAAGRAAAGGFCASTAHGKTSTTASDEATSFNAIMINLRSRMDAIITNLGALDKSGAGALE